MNLGSGEGSKGPCEHTRHLQHGVHRFSLETIDSQCGVKMWVLPKIDSETYGQNCFWRFAKSCASVSKRLTFSVRTTSMAISTAFLCLMKGTRRSRSYWSWASKRPVVVHMGWLLSMRKAWFAWATNPITSFVVSFFWKSNDYNCQIQHHTRGKGQQASQDVPPLPALGIKVDIFALFFDQIRSIKLLVSISLSCIFSVLRKKYIGTFLHENVHGAGTCTCTRAVAVARVY